MLLWSTNHQSWDIGCSVNLSRASFLFFIQSITASFLGFSSLFPLLLIAQWYKQYPMARTKQRPRRTASAANLVSTAGMCVIHARFVLLGLKACAKSSLPFTCFASPSQWRPWQHLPCCFSLQCSHGTTAIVEKPSSNQWTKQQHAVGYHSRESKSLATTSTTNSKWTYAISNAYHNICSSLNTTCNNWGWCW